MFNFYQINKNTEIQTCDRLVIKTLVDVKKSSRSQNMNSKYVDDEGNQVLSSILIVRSETVKEL